MPVLGTLISWQPVVGDHSVGPANHDSLLQSVVAKNLPVLTCFSHSVTFALLEYEAFQLLFEELPFSLSAYILCPSLSLIPTCCQELLKLVLSEHLVNRSEDNVESDLVLIPIGLKLCELKFFSHA